MSKDLRISMKEKRERGERLQNKIEDIVQPMYWKHRMQLLLTGNSYITEEEIKDSALKLLDVIDECKKENTDERKIQEDNRHC